MTSPWFARSFAGVNLFYTEMTASWCIDPSKKIVSKDGQAYLTITNMFPYFLFFGNKEDLLDNLEDFYHKRTIRFHYDAVIPYLNIRVYDAVDWISVTYYGDGQYFWSSSIPRGGGGGGGGGGGSSGW